MHPVAKYIYYDVVGASSVCSQWREAHFDRLLIDFDDLVQAAAFPSHERAFVLIRRILARKVQPCGSALSVAASVGNEALVLYLLPRLATGEVDNALLMMARHGCNVAVLSLLSDKVPTSVVGQALWQALLHALRPALKSKRRAVVTTLLSHLGRQRVVTTHDVGQALVLAAKQGDVDVFSTILRLTPEWHSDYVGEALYEASCQGHEPVVSMLLDTLLDGQVDNIYKGWALENAALHGHTGVIETMLGKGRVRADRNECGAVTAAVVHGHPNVVRMLVAAKRGAPTFLGMKHAFKVAARLGEAESVKAMLASYDHESDDDTTMLVSGLTVAAENGRCAVVRAILETTGMRADVCDGIVLVAAAANGNLGVVRLLLGWHNGPVRPDCLGGAALLQAMRHAHMEVASLLRQSRDAFV